MSWRWIHARRPTFARSFGRPEPNATSTMKCRSIAMQTRMNSEAGMSEAEANRKARIAFGGLEPIKEHSRDVRPLRWARDPPGPALCPALAATSARLCGGGNCDAGSRHRRQHGALRRRLQCMLRPLAFPEPIGSCASGRSSPRRTCVVLRRSRTIASCAIATAHSTNSARMRRGPTVPQARSTSSSRPSR